MLESRSFRFQEIWLCARAKDGRHAIYFFAESKRNKKLVEEHFEAVESDAEGSGQEEDGSEDGSDDEDLEAGASKPGSRGAGGGAPPRSDRDGGGRGKAGSLFASFA